MMKPKHSMVLRVNVYEPSYLSLRFVVVEYMKIS